MPVNNTFWSLDDYLINGETNMSADLMNFIFFGLEPCGLTKDIFRKKPYEHANHHPLFPKNHYDSLLALVHSDLPKSIINNCINWNGVMHDVHNSDSVFVILTMPMAFDRAKKTAHLYNIFTDSNAYTTSSIS